MWLCLILVMIFETPKAWISDHFQVMKSIFFSLLEFWSWFVCIFKDTTYSVYFVFKTKYSNVAILKISDWHDSDYYSSKKNIWKAIPS